MDIMEYRHRNRKHIMFSREGSLKTGRWALLGSIPPVSCDHTMPPWEGGTVLHVDRED